MIPGSAVCRFRWIDSTSAAVPRLVLESVFHLSILKLERSSCAPCAACCSCDSNWLSSFAELTETGGSGVCETACDTCAAAMPASRIETDSKPIFIGSSGQHTHFWDVRKIPEVQTPQRLLTLR